MQYFTVETHKYKIIKTFHAFKDNDNISFSDGCIFLLSTEIDSEFKWWMERKKKRGESYRVIQIKKLDGVKLKYNTAPKMYCLLVEAPKRRYDKSTLWFEDQLQTGI